MTIFNSYVSLPEGTSVFMGIEWNWNGQMMINQDIQAS